MFCMKCGTNNPDAGAYCMKCGAPLAGQAVTASGAAAAPASTTRRVGEQFVVPRLSPSLPLNCVKCGRPTRDRLNKTFYWHHPLIYLIVLVNLIIYAIVALVVRKSCKLDVPLCEEHRGSYKTKRWVGGLMMAASIPVPIAVGVLGNASDEAVLIAILLFLVLLLAGAIIFGLANPIKPTKMDEQTATFKGAGESFLQLLPS